MAKKDPNFKTLIIVSSANPNDHMKAIHLKYSKNETSTPHEIYKDINSYNISITANHKQPTDTIPLINTAIIKYLSRDPTYKHMPLYYHLAPLAGLKPREKRK